MASEQHLTGESLQSSCPETAPREVLDEPTNEAFTTLDRLASQEPGFAQHLLYKPVPVSVPARVSPYPTFTALPGYVKPLTTHITADDLAYLEINGALTLPSRKCQEQLIWCFFEYVYPLMPIVDLDTFAQALESPGGSPGGISLLLLQAVLFAGSAHIKLEQLRDAGFSTSEEARKVLFRRAQLLYDSGTEADPLVLVQALTLMTLWYESSEQHRNTWHRSKTALSQCYAAGFHMDPSRSSLSLSSNTQKLRRRVWWVCFMRERILSLGMRQPQRLNEVDHSVLLLESSDFESSFQRPKSFQKFCSYANDKTKSGKLAYLCIMMAKLCCCMRPHISIHDASHRKAARSDEFDLFSLLRNKERSAFTDCNEDLLEWRKSLSEPCKTLPLVYSSKNPAKSTLILNEMLLEMTYLAIIATRHRERFISLGHGSGDSLLNRELSKLHMQNAASQISSMTEEIHRCGLDTLLPSMAIGVLMTAASIHRLDPQGITHGEKRRAMRGFRQCMAVVSSLKSIYVASEPAEDSIDWAFLINDTSSSQLLGSHVNTSSHYTDSLDIFNEFLDLGTATSPSCSNSNKTNGEALT
ncbi:hypothetical protein FSARC_8277 [Fusarium sarcochroum]|uniref:Xylanolytic transcriptional activator regulatory domain-containing protein n=1 Tax=Fusarium sarcochroum TaxID=1208366 RepID=A0A8H4TTL9_9HYPO|nr:hypothetical protein FSARC_8277 [Fusarium sarcochroum]